MVFDVVVVDAVAVVPVDVVPVVVRQLGNKKTVARIIAAAIIKVFFLIVNSCE